MKLLATCYFLLFGLSFFTMIVFIIVDTACDCISYSVAVFPALLALGMVGIGIVFGMYKFTMEFWGK